jgi:hypothetical protein
MVIAETCHQGNGWLLYCSRRQRTSGSRHRRARKSLQERTIGSIPHTGLETEDFGAPTRLRVGPVLICPCRHLHVDRATSKTCFAFFGTRVQLRAPFANVTKAQTNILLHACPFLSRTTRPSLPMLHITSVRRLRRLGAPGGSGEPSSIRIKLRRLAVSTAHLTVLIFRREIIVVSFDLRRSRERGPRFSFTK